LRQSVQAIADLITTPGLINLDLADVKAVIKDAGFALVGIGIGRGNNKASTAAEAAISSPLLEVSIKGSNSIIVNVTGGLDMSLYEVNEIVDLVSKAAGRDANIVFGAIISENMQDEVRVTVIATKCEKAMPLPVNQEETETITIRDKIEQEERKRERISPFFSGSLVENPILTDKKPESDIGKPSVEETVGPAKKYQEKEDLDIPTFLRKKYRR